MTILSGGSGTMNEKGFDFGNELDFDYNEDELEADYFEGSDLNNSDNILNYFEDLNSNENTEDNVDFYDSEEFTSFISSGYGTTSRPSSTVMMEPSGIINSLHLNIPELEPILSSGSSPARRITSTTSTPIKGRAKMTDIGFKMSKMIMNTQGTGSSEHNGNGDDLESGDALVDNYGQGRKKQKTGIRGRPKGTSKVGTQFGRASSTHSLPPNVGALMGQANLAYVQKQYPRAIELYLQVVRRAPASPEPYYSLGLVYEEQGDADKAASYFLITAHLQPRPERDLWRRIAALLVQVPRKDQAIYCLIRAIKAPKPPDYRVEDDFPLFWLRAKLQLERAEYRSVITGFSTALRGHFSQDPDDLQLFILVAKLAVRMSLSYLAVGMFENVFRSVVQAALPLTWSHLNILVELCEVDGDYAAVLSSIEEFAVPCYLQSGREQGRTDWILKSSQEQLEKALESEEMPWEFKLKMRIAQIHLKQTDTCGSEVLELLSQVERPGIKLKLAVGDALTLVNEPLEAVKIMLECLDEDSTLATSEMCLKIGQNYKKAGEFEMAVESFLAVLQVDPEHRETRFALSEVYRSLGKIEQALQVLPEGMEVNSVDSSNLINNAIEGENKFINWDGLNELFEKVIGIAIDTAEDVKDDFGDDGASVSDSDSEVYKDSGSRNNKLRFGPERQKRKNRKSTNVTKFTCSTMLRSNFKALRESRDRQAGGQLLQYFSENVNNINSIIGELSVEEWSEALLQVLILQASEFSPKITPKSEWDRLIRIFKNILASSLKVDLIRWRVLGLVLGEMAGRWDDFMIENVKSLISTSNTNNNNTNNNLMMTCLVPSLYLPKSAAFLASFYHPITFRFMSRLNLRHFQSNPALLVLLGHESLETLNYDEAARMYGKALDIQPTWRFLKLCIGNALLGRCFQRTCSNQLAKLTQALSYFVKYYEEDVNDLQGCYNAGRAFHQAGFLSQAIHFYKKCSSSTSSSSSNSGDGTFLELAKYNLSRLYLQSGSPAMCKLILKNQ